MVSVVMAVRNVQAFIAESLESVLAQTFSALELVVVDDCSTDATWDICRGFASRDSRIKLMRNEQNLRVARSVNKGLKLCSAPWIARMDGDDVCAPTRLQKQMTFLVANPAVGLCGTGFACVDEQGRFLHRPRIYTGDEELRFFLVLCNPIHQPTVVMDRRVLDSVGGYDERFTNGAEDYDLWARMAPMTRLANLPDDLLKYRIRKRSFSKDVPDVFWPLHFSVSRRLLSAYLGRTVAQEEAADLGRFQLSHARLSLERLGVVKGLIRELETRVLRREPYHLAQALRLELGHSFLDQSVFQTYYQPLESSRLLTQALRYHPRLLMSKAALAQIARLGKALVVGKRLR